MQIGDFVASTHMPQDSHYRFVAGKITDIRNGWATVDATIVQDKWSASPYQHPTSCRTSVKLEYLVKQ